jgi:RNA polymerase-interacting CarD/CdnL/TRCF family regulator
MLVRARGILVSELSFALNVSEEEALGKLEEQLA